MGNFKLPDLPYKENSLEPYIDEETMRIHHGKHHKAYVDKLNLALEGHEKLQKKSVEELLKELDKIPEDIKVKNIGNESERFSSSDTALIVGSKQYGYCPKD